MPNQNVMLRTLSIRLIHTVMTNHNVKPNQNVMLRTFSIRFYTMDNEQVPDDG